MSRRLGARTLALPLQIAVGLSRRREGWGGEEQERGSQARVGSTDPVLKGEKPKGADISRL